MDKMKIKYFKDSFEWYQPFNIPPFNNIKGRFGYLDREILNPALLPKNLRGKTLLEIGSNTGKYCLEAKLRGAKRVIGIDNSEFFVEKAKTIAKLTGIKGVEYLRFDANDASKLGKFNYVAMFSVIHLKTVNNPLQLLKEAYICTNEVFITEIFTRFFWRHMNKFGFKILLKHPLPTTNGMKDILNKDVGFKKVYYAGKNKNGRDLFICFKK